ncbi:PREDICTED: probable cation-transporting ATPase 13A3 [Vollenhovia emeryi]|uniref:probable cation-transporting ATPase 13A3 n=1 Tax=Vollenhovia emeryi TaxID=411798 RepID=UPI0005F517AB|nr:PREDICTED: probable cation-transporting ATPase 13A3 [Vollenhovia emeryi]XP_011865401.1 PREDICTED: probable cation-transporting ATPase 13A3 [Vollenhovia emeryi]XP_011865402.1 PREDICTED: probable cation-transporting ATPase 13A3 [Vollenhovia emeryi]
MVDVNGVNDNEKSDALWQKIHTDQNEHLHIYGFEKSSLRTTVTYVSYVLTVGLVRLLFHWYPRLHLYATHRKCALNCATKILAIDEYQGFKSYFVQDVQEISTRNVSAKSLLATLGTVDQGLLEKIKDKKLQINLENGTRREVREYKAFWCKKKCYVWDTTNNIFSRLVGLDNGTMCSDLHLSRSGLSKEEQLLRRVVYGNNAIVVPLQSIGVLLLLEVLNPFYIFQVFTLSVWFAEGYLYYTIAIILMSLFGITSSIVQTRKNQINLRGTVASSESVRVLRDTGTFENISSEELVPGDLIELPRHRATLVCDAVLLTGQCILNESMLTGESVPVTKTFLPLRCTLYDAKEHTYHTLYSGTTIIQTKYHDHQPVLARVIRTGFLTNRGALIAAILYPPPADFKFDKDSYKFIGILAFIATCGFIYTVILKVSRGILAGDIAIKALDIITIVIPPALPAAMTVGKLYAQARLKRAQIYCINNRVINVSGSINCVCFDKTGTLTENGLDMWGVVPCTNGVLAEAETDIPKLKGHALFEGMLVCHSLTLIDGELCGDPLDAKMFESTKWILKDSDCTHVNKYDSIAPIIVSSPDKTSLTKDTNEITEIGIIQQYQFSSSLQRMSVIVHASGSDDFRAYVKGSPEMIIDLSKAETVPQDISLVLEQFTKRGFRVIAMGRRAIASKSSSEISRLSRETVERDLEFLGLVILENRLKQPTAPVIRELREANIRVMMITGDNIQTAASVARECGILSTEEHMVDVSIVSNDEKDRPEITFNIQSPSPRLKSQDQHHSISPTIKDVERGIAHCNYRFALTGQTWQMMREHYPDLVDRVCVRSAIFARMSSDQKQQVVVELMRLGYYVAMCGDGANDCGALRAAHVGISLSKAESSVASPFTSRIPDISCVLKVIREGRAALVTSFGIFKFMIAYSLTEFLSVIILYFIDSNLTDLQFLFIDICLIINFAFFFGKTRACVDKLSKTPPMTSLLSFTPLFSLTAHMLVMTLFQATAFHAVQQFPWFTPFVPTSNTGYTCYENYSVYCVSMFQYITMAIIFSRGKPYRRAIYTNGAFIFSILLLTAICAYITVYPAVWVVNALELILPPVYDWRLAILALALANFLICLFVESLVIERVIENTCKRKLYRPEKSKKQYLKIEHELKNCQSWPKFKGQLPMSSVLRKEGDSQNVATITYNSHCRYSIGDQTANDVSNSSKRPSNSRNGENGFENFGFANDQV